MMWEDFIEDPSLISALKANNMHSPTEIQKASLLSSCKHRQDIIVSSKTGSGKTLCFAIPILMFTEKNNTLQSLIISPTRELCLQIAAHINAVNYKALTVQTLIGGMSHEKQERLIKRKPEIVIATPGRLWEYIKDRQNDYLRGISEIKFLVIDEADRMIQMGHFRELRFLLSYIENPASIPKEAAVLEQHDNVVDLNFALNEEAMEDETNASKAKKNKRQTFVISATMTIEKSARKAFSGKLGRFKDDGEDILDKLNKTIVFRGKPKLIDLTASSRLPEGLKEYIVLCRDEQKSSLLHYILNDFKSVKTIIFTNTISTSHKLSNFLKYLDYNVSKLDGKMQQRDRLKKLERFLKGNNILIATDVAARGLDLPEVGLIIHYNLPQNIENYIHRSGRTARIYKEGVSLAFVGPSDTKSLYGIEKLLGKKIEKYEVDDAKLMKSVEVVKIAEHIAESEFVNMGRKKDFSWQEKASDAVGLEGDGEKPQVAKRHINKMKKILQHAKVSTDLPRKRAAVITPELFEMAKKQKLI